MPVHLVYMSLDTLQRIYNTTQSGSLDPLFYILRFWFWDRKTPHVIKQQNITILQ